MRRRRSCEGCFVGGFVALGMCVAFYRDLGGLVFLGIVQAVPFGKAKDWMWTALAK